MRASHTLWFLALVYINLTICEKKIALIGEYVEVFDPLTKVILLS